MLVNKHYTRKLVHKQFKNNGGVPDCLNALASANMQHEPTGTPLYVYRDSIIMMHIAQLAIIMTIIFV